MNPDWLFWTVAASVMIGCTAFSVDILMDRSGLQRRWVWTLAIALTLGSTGLAAFRPAVLPDLGIYRSIASLSMGEEEAASSEILNPTVSAPSFAVDNPIMPERPPLDSPSTWRGVFSVTFGALWVALSVMLLLSYFAAWLGSKRARESWKSESVEGADVLVSETWGPAVVGMWQPRIVLPAWVLNAPKPSRQLIIAHEREHLAAHDSRLLAAAALALVVIPINPVLWWLRKRLHEAVEMDCDSRVVASEKDLGAYLDVLLASACRSRMATGWLSLAFGPPRSFLEKRVWAMTRQRRRRMTVSSLGLASVAALGLLLSLDAVAQVPSASFLARSGTYEGVPAPMSGSLSPDDASSTEADIRPPKEDSPLAADSLTPLSANIPEAELPAESPEVRQGSITGSVSDAQSGEPLQHAQVFIENLGLGTLTDLRGQYELSPVPIGSHTVAVVLPGYRNAYTEVLVEEGRTSLATHGLFDEAMSAGEVIIRPTSEELLVPVATTPGTTNTARSAPGGADRMPTFTVWVRPPTLENLAELAAAIRNIRSGPANLTVWVYVDETGSVLDTRLTAPSGNRSLDELVEDMMRNQARFAPALNRDEARAVWAQVPITVTMD